MQERTRQVILAWLPAVLYMGLIWVLSSFPLPELPIGRIPLRDKMLHAVEYMVLAVFVAHAVLRTWPDRTWPRLTAVALLIAIAWGMLDEIHQAFVPGRTSDLIDLAADTIGASVGATLRFAIAIFFSNKGRIEPLRNPST